jgi:alpha-beta hydrolase superfamily lysophospholipase
MTPHTTLELDGTRGRIALHRWENSDPRFVVVLAHGYGEHAGRYAHVAERLVAEGAVVYAPDHLGHGRSEGERALIEDFEDVLSDFESVERLARSEHPDVAVVLIGHSMGGVIATRYVQTRSPDLRALVLSGPVIGGNSAIEGLLGMDPIPEIPIDPAVLSRDPDVGRAYAEDELVYHGAFKKPTLEALFGAIRAIADGPGLNSLPLLWIHGEEDALAPLAETRPAVERIRGDDFEQHVYPGAQHEVFNETNRAEVIDDVVAFVSARCAS